MKHGTRVSIRLGAAQVPGIVIGEPEESVRTTGAGQSIPSQRQWVISKRANQATGEIYFAQTYEAVGLLTFRFGEAVEGLDAEDGIPLTFERLMSKVSASLDAYLSRRRTAVPA